MKKCPVCLGAGEVPDDAYFSQVAPVHHIENVGGDPTKFHTACHKYQWDGPPLVVDSQARIHEVTCVECLTAMRTSQ